MPALIFDCDGVLADTERYGHLPAFNQTFAEFGPAGAVERGRVRREARDRRRQGADGPTCSLPVRRRGRVCRPRGRAGDLVATWHRRKTGIYTGGWPPGGCRRGPGSPGSSERRPRPAGGSRSRRRRPSRPCARCWSTPSAPTLAARFTVFAGDIVPPRSRRRTSTCSRSTSWALDPGRRVVVEDSGNGLRAALAAGLACVVTVSGYTADEDFTGAALVVSRSATRTGRRHVLANPPGVRPGAYVTLPTSSAAASRDRTREQGPCP